MTHRLAGILVAVLSMTAVGAGAGDEAAAGAGRQGLTWVVSPLFGWERNELNVPGPAGQTMKVTDTSPEYGLFALVAHPNFVVNNFLFWSRVNDTDVLGDLAYANYYLDATAPVTLNLGAGYLYHKIEADNEEIEINVPMVKIGPQIRWASAGIQLNPYVGYAWETVDTLHGDQDNDSYMYGLTIDWRWRMLAVNLKYYHQDSQDLDEDFNTFHGRFTTMFNKHWGGVVRVDYMEHSTSTDKSVLFGPAYVF